MGPIERIIAIETSCDDTSVAIVNRDGVVESCCSAHQDLVHAPFGGVVPEGASRSHTENLLPLIEAALAKGGRSWPEIHGIAVTSRPGLMGSLMVGVVTAKTLALAKALPWIDVNHIEGHLLAPFLKDEAYSPPTEFTFPYLALAISGGHTHMFKVEKIGTYHLLSQTLDDAAGEAFDKFAKLLGLGYPGGVQVDRLSVGGNLSQFQFPRAMIREETLDFSFSGLKAAAQRLLESLSEDQRRSSLADLCASFQEAIVDVLLNKLERAALAHGLSKIALTGGVSANSRLRARVGELATKQGWVLALPPLRYCTDNAAMIGLAGLRRLEAGERAGMDVGPSASSLPADFLT